MSAVSVLPLLWLLATVALAFRRPGLLLGCAYSSYNFSTFYGAPAMGPLLLFGVIAIVAAIVFYQIFILRQTRFSVFSFELVLMLFCFVYCVSSLYALGFNYGLVQVVRFLTVCIGYYLIARILCSHEKYSDGLITDFAISVTLLAGVFGFLALGVSTSLGRLNLGGSDVGFSTVFDAALVSCMIYFLAAPPHHGRARKAAVLAALAFVGYFSLLNATRGTVLSLAFAVCIFGGVITFAKSHGGTRKRAMISLGFLALALLAMVTQFVVGTSDNRLAAGIARLVTNFGSTGYRLDESASDRLALLRVGWDLFTTAPILGHGPGSYTFLTGNTYPHNLFVELLAENGILGTAIFSAVLAGFWVLGLRLLKVTNFSISASIAIGIFLIGFAHQQVSGTFWFAKPIFLSMGAMAGLLSHALSSNVTARERSPSQPGSADGAVTRI